MEVGREKDRAVVVGCGRGGFQRSHYGYIKHKHKAHMEISARVIDSYTGLDHACWCIHILIVFEAKWDAFWSQADEHDRKKKGRNLVMTPKFSRLRSLMCTILHWILTVEVGKWMV